MELRIPAKSMLTNKYDFSQGLEFRFRLSRDWPVVNDGGNQSTPLKPSPYPQVTGNFLTWPNCDSNTTLTGIFLIFNLQSRFDSVFSH